MALTGRALVRVGDKVEGTCYAHSSPRSYIGTWTQGSSVCSSEGLQMIRVGDHGVTDCGHHITAIEGSFICTADGIGIHRVGDAVVVDEGGDGITVTGAQYGFAL